MAIPESVLNALGQSTNTATTKAVALAGNPLVLVGAAILIVVAILLVVFLKRFVENSVLGIVVWAIAKFALGINLPFWASLIVSAIFGLAGIGAMLALWFLGVI